MTSTYRSNARVLGIASFNEWTWKNMRWEGAASVLPRQLVKMLGEIWLGDQMWRKQKLGNENITENHK